MLEFTGIDGLEKYNLVKRILEYTKKHTLWGLGGLPIYNVLEFFIKSITEGAISVRASSVAFNFFLGIFPAIIFFFTLIPYIPIANFQFELLKLIEDVTPGFAYETIESTITDIATTKRGGLLSFGFISALYFSTKGINSLLVAFKTTSLVFENRNWFTQQFVSVFLTLIVVLLITTAVILITITDPVLDYFLTQNIILEDLIFLSFFVGKWLIVFFSFYLSISSIYYFASASRKNWNFFSTGSVIATVLGIVISVGFAFFVNNFGQYNKLYGSLGTLIVILMWIYLNSFVIILGFELNVSIKNARNMNQLLTD